MHFFDRVRLSLAVGIAKATTAAVKRLKRGAGSVLPGAIARRLQPRILPLLLAQAKQGVILIAGTNGKTTTALLLRTLLVARGWRVTHNATGANLLNGLITALLADTNWLGQVQTDWAVLEVDENVLPLVLRDSRPRYILALNLFRDQLDRYGEVDTISYRWRQAIAPLPESTTLVLNADDPALSFLGQNLAQRVLYFGLNEPQLYLEDLPHAVDSIDCPSCGQRLTYRGVYLSHLGDYTCDRCGFQRSPLSLDSAEWGQILIGVYNKYNTLAAGLVAQDLGLERALIDQVVRDFRAAFGRAEELTVQGKQVRILLSKNPVGTNETIRTVSELKAQGKSSVTLLVLNDRIPDGTDVSWIWDVDTEKLVALGGTLVVSGDRVYDLALRLRYSCEQAALDPATLTLLVEPDLPRALQAALDATPPEETLHILPTYSAMLDVRQLLTGRKIL